MGEQEPLRLLLASGAEHKHRRLLASLESLGLGREFVLRSVNLGERAPDELNDMKEAQIVYAAKARHTFGLLKDNLKRGEYGITSDVHPKVGRPKQTLDQALVKNLNLVAVAPHDRQEQMAEYIESIFGRYGNDEMLMRIGVGIVAWTCPQGLIGMVASKAYLYFPHNPLPDQRAAHDYLDYCREHKDDKGVYDNQELERSANSPAAILQESLLPWVLENGGRAVANVRTEDPGNEILQLVNGFADEATKELFLMISGHRGRTGHNSREWREEKLTLLPKWRQSLIFDREENRVVVNNQVRITE